MRDFFEITISLIQNRDDSSKDENSLKCEIVVNFIKDPPELHVKQYKSYDFMDINLQLYRDFRNEFDNEKCDLNFCQKIFQKYKVHLILNETSINLDKNIINQFKGFIINDIKGIRKLTMRGIHEKIIDSDVINAFNSIRVCAVSNQSDFIIHKLESIALKNSQSDFQSNLRKYLINKLVDYQADKPKKETSLMGTISSSTTFEEEHELDAFKDWKKYGKKWINDLNNQDTPLQKSLQVIVDDILEFTNLTDKIRNYASKTWLASGFFNSPSTDESLRSDKIKAKFLKEVMAPMILVTNKISNIYNIKYTGLVEEKIITDSDGSMIQSITVPSCQSIVEKWVNMINQCAGYSLRVSNISQELELSVETILNCQYEESLWEAFNNYVPERRVNCRARESQPLHTG